MNRKVLGFALGLIGTAIFLVVFAGLFTWAWEQLEPHWWVLVLIGIVFFAGLIFLIIAVVAKDSDKFCLPGMKCWK